MATRQVRSSTRNTSRQQPEGDRLRAAGSGRRRPRQASGPGPYRRSGELRGADDRPDATPGYLALTGDGSAPSLRNEVSARIALNLIRYRPGRRARNVTCPILFSLCERDSVAPAAAAQRYAATASRSETHLYDCGHFDVYLSDYFDSGGR